MINDNTAKWRVKKLGNIIGSNGYWQPNEEVKVGTIRFPMGEDNIGYVLECVEAGTTGEEQPTLIGEEIANYAEVGRVGQVRVIFNLAEKDVDEVMAMGITYSRLTYPELWEWAGKRAGLIISEEEWQAKFAETNGKFVPYYSSGDGSSTFRTPLLGAYLKGAESGADVGKWLDAGLPNATGSIYIRAWGSANGSLMASASGVLSSTKTVLQGNVVASSSTNGYNDLISVDLSKSNAIYGNSDTVTPETMTGVWVIKAVGVVVDSGETDIANVLTATEQVQERVSAVENELPKKANLGALSMPSAYYTSVSLNIENNTSSWADFINIYIAPSDGWVLVTVEPGSASGRSVLRVQSGNLFHLVSATSSAHSTHSLCVPIAKGAGLTVSTVNTSSRYTCHFIYAQSEV